MVGGKKEETPRALAAEMEGLARRDVMRRRRQERLDDALAAAADESAVDETEAGGAGRRPMRPVDATARRARGSVAVGRARVRTTTGRVPMTQ
jgi:hypothetical protein